MISEGIKSIEGRFLRNRKHLNWTSNVKRLLGVHANLEWNSRCGFALTACPGHELSGHYSGSLVISHSKATVCRSYRP